MNNLNDIFFAPAANQDLTYDQVLEDVQRYFAENHASTIAEAGEGNAERATTLLKELMVQYIVKRKYAIEGLTTEELCEKLYEDMAGYSFLKKWIYKPGIEEVNINAYNDIEVIEAGGRSIKIPDKFSSPQHAIDVVRRMLNACGMVIDDTMPSVVGFLDKNIRISVDKTPIVDPDVGINASITTPKTASGTRTIPILYPQVAEQLRTLIEVMDTLYPEDLVMNGYHGFLFRNREGYFLSAHNINRAIQRISIAYNAEEMDQAELEDREPELLPHFSVHNMRHTFCTRLCESTNDIKFIQQVMGHADFSTTMDIYTHITQENMREKAEAIKGNLVLM